MRLLDSARSLHRSLTEQGARLAASLENLEDFFGDASGFAHAAEIAPDQREEFAGLITRLHEVLPSQAATPSTSADRIPRMHWAREAFAPYRTIDEELDRALASRPAGDAGQGTSHGVVRDENRDGMRDGSEEREATPKSTGEQSREPSPPPELSKSVGKQRAE
jgi:hypothetical protein